VTASEENSARTSTRKADSLSPPHGTPPTNSLWTTGLVLAFVAALSLVVGLFLGSSGSNSQLVEFAKPPSMSDCMTGTLRVLDLKQSPTSDNLRQVVEHCYSLLRSDGLLRDFAIRELTFAQQYRANGILMWLVVIITLSGVLLAAVQLIASYRLAEASKAIFAGSQEIAIKRDQLVLKSSVTGLFILLLSFAFFLAFVFYVYRIEKPEDSSPRSPQESPTLPMGGLGPPPPSPPNP
jgi:hypothetical protein